MKLSSKPEYLRFMNSIMDYLSSHPLAVMVVAFVVLIVVYFIFKQLIKLALLVVLIALAIGGYYYFKDPKKTPEDIHQTIRDVRTQAGTMVETGTKAYQKSKDVYEKSRELTKGAKEFLQKKEEETEEGAK
jgi:ABC-type bacteriocin/lantibiotic exporter with double-glycine peptidase domain